jgi:23S rRNA pseudouridine1911/1915/1917 synthase
MTESYFDEYRFTTDPGQGKVRIDKFLLDKIEGVSRTKIQKVAEEGGVLVNGNPVKVNFKVLPGMEVHVKVPRTLPPSELIPQEIELDIKFENDEVIVINKPAGMVVHPGHGNPDGTLVNALLHHFGTLPTLSELDNRPGLVHRLDKDTSGLMVVAKTEKSMANLAKQFMDRTIHRKYIALVWGTPKEEEGTIKTNLARHLKDRRIVDNFEFEGEHGKHAITHYKVLQSYNYVSLVECKLETGRTHQIRAHMAHIGHPLFNDEAYGGQKVLKGMPTQNYKRFIQNCFDLIPGQALHAKELGFQLLENKENLFFEEKIPVGFENIVLKFESK